MSSQYNVTATNILECGWEKSIPINGNDGYHAISSALQRASQTAAAEKREVDSRALNLLSAATSMMFNSKNVNTPFGPAWSTNTHRSAIPDDFTQDDLEAISQASKGIGNAFIRARLADIAWLSQKQRNIEVARTACDAYFEIPLESQTWASSDAVDAWTRAVVLLRQLGQGETARLQKFATALLDKARLATPYGGFFLKKISSILLEGELAREASVEMGSLLEKYAGEVRASGDYRQVRIYLESAARWFDIAKNQERKFDCLCAAAETFVSEADQRLSGSQPSHMVAASFYEDAIQAFRAIPKAQRVSRGLGGRIDEIHKNLNVSGEESLKEMVTIRSPAVDMSRVVEASKEFVRGKPFWDAVHAFTQVFSTANLAERKNQTERKFRDNPLQAMVNQTHVSSDGRAVAIRPGISLHDANAVENLIALQAEMVKGYAFDISVGVRVQIYPALQTLRLEHQIKLDDLIELVRQCPVVPPNRHQLIAKALFYGFDGDHETALHLVTPQVEHLVRWHLNRKGVKTTTLNKEGIETENGLSTIAASPEMNDVFGQELTFEIRSLFCDPFGPNLRNELAHGLLDSYDCSSEHSVYAWWFLLRLVVSEVVAAQLRKSTAGSADMPDATEGTESKNEEPSSDETQVSASVQKPMSAFGFVAKIRGGISRVWSALFPPWAHRN